MIDIVPEPTSLESAIENAPMLIADAAERAIRMIAVGMQMRNASSRT